MPRAVIVDIVRSPFAKGRQSGALADAHPVDLFAQVLRGLVDRTGIDPHLIDDVIAGCVLQVAEQSGNVARQAALAAGLPESVPGVSLDRKCGSAQQALDFAAQGIIAGAYDFAIAGGVEMMSRVPMRANRMGKDNLGPLFHERYREGLVRQGISAELIAAKWQLSRTEQDAYAVRSHARAAAFEDAGHSQKDIIPIRIESEHGEARIVTSDEGIRRETSLEGLAALTPSFADEALSARFPEIDWGVTAGNASQVTDGATAILLASEAAAARYNLTPRAAVTHFAVTGDDPILMLTGIIPATEKLLSRAGIGLAHIDRFEVNEAFASVVLAWLKETGADPACVNAHGGAIALGHPVGASGGRLTANLIRGLEISGGTLGLQTMCESGGMANATLFERL
ncbi:MAG: thiolase family protein [Pseudomonadota bacterium]